MVIAPSTSVDKQIRKRGPGPSGARGRRSETVCLCERNMRGQRERDGTETRRAISPDDHHVSRTVLVAGTGPITTYRGTLED